MNMRKSMRRKFLRWRRVLPACGSAVRQASSPATACGRRRCAFFSLGVRCGLGERNERERAREWHREGRGVSRGLFIGSAGPQTARINCARSINAPGFGAHVRGVTVASCNGHIVGHGVQPHSTRSPRESRRQPLGQRTLEC